WSSDVCSSDLRTPADADRESRTRVHAGCSASGERELPLLRPQAGQEASLLHREHRRVSALRGDARLRHALIGGGTRLVALIGHPVAHSLSPRMQNAAFAALGLDWVYVALDVPPERLEAALRGLDGLGFAGANVTAPHKQAVARIVGSDLPSVNTLVAGGAAYSTDTAILELVTNCRKPVIVGDGGAAAAFRHALPDAVVYS